MSNIWCISSQYALYRCSFDVLTSHVTVYVCHGHLLTLLKIVTLCFSKTLAPLPFHWKTLRPMSSMNTSPDCSRDFAAGTWSVQTHPTLCKHYVIGPISCKKDVQQKMKAFSEKCISSFSLPVFLSSESIAEQNFERCGFVTKKSITLFDTLSPK